MSMRFSNGGSAVTFLPGIKCCVPSCGAVRDENNKKPYYTFPTDVGLCIEWLNEIQLNKDEIGDLSSLHETLAVCYKHFQINKSGMKLCIGTNHASVSQVKTPSTDSKVSSCTQTVDDEWIRMLKKELNLNILYGNHIQCRVCARISVQAVSIYSKCNKERDNAFYLQDLINSLMPIEVKPKDKKPLNICVHCIFKLKEYRLLFNHCLKNDQNFNLLNECTKSKKKKTNLSGQKKNKASEVIRGLELDNDTQNTDAFVLNDDSEGTTKDEHMNKSKLSKLTSNSYGFIQQETRQHVIKLVLPAKFNTDDKSAEKNNRKNQFSNAKVIYVKFMAKYIICADREWIDEIHINKDQLKYSKETIDMILKNIYNTVKNPNETIYSKIVPLEILPLHLDSKVTPTQQVQTTSVIIGGETYLNIKINEKTNETLKEGEPSKKTWECDRCGFKLNNKKYYTSHIKLCHPKPCHFCRQHITPSSKLFEHEKEHRKRLDGFICHLCGHRCISNKSLIAHYKQHQSQKQICCKICNLQFSNGFGLRKHLRQQHKELIVKKPEEIQKNKQKCSKCSLWLSSKLALRVHMRTHLPIEERRKFCPICNKGFVNPYRLKLHVKTHGPCPIKCLECPRLFPSQEHLDYHLHCHKITEPVYCDICHRYFKSKITLRQHINRIHRGIQYIQKKFTCVFCKNVFASKVELLTHTNMHTLKEKAQAFSGDEYGKIQCNECDKYFLYKSRLSLHKMYHHSSLCTTGNSINQYCKTKGSNALQFCCQYCTKRFNSTQRLGCHERSHGLNYRFHCTVCNKWFTKLSVFIMHSDSHFGITQNTCNICGKIFKSISTLNNHTETNHKEKHLPNDLNNQGLNQIHNSVLLPANVTENNDNEFIMNNISDGMNGITTLTELDDTLSTVQDSNLSGTHEHTTPIELDFMTSMNSTIMMPEVDSQDFLCNDLPHDIDIPQDLKITDQQLESVEILDLQSLYNE